MVSSADKSILLVYGAGGHSEQMSRLLNIINGKHHAHYVALTEPKAKLRCEIPEVCYVCALREKYRNYSRFTDVLRIIGSFMANIVISYKMVRKFNVRLIISTGPGIAIPVALVGRLLGRNVIHIETWCRFYTRSHTGRFMYYLANDFWLQNNELQKLYPKARYVGSL